ncbi:MAG TPA: class I SAM-dependent methyltransferase [Thermoplasmata archaeon]|nr:class I SAM-dependent methyltransferase [Thermoplasmata archaeon]
MPHEPGRAHWTRWLDRWDRQQESFNPTREARFTTMMDVLEAQLGRRFTVLDLGAGPGSFSARILRRFPAARSFAVDYDPVVRRIGQGALGTFGGRLTWVDAKLGAPGWRSALPSRRFDAAVSTTALHWLTPAQLSRLYSDLGRAIRPRGVFLNGDYLPWEPAQRDLRRIGAGTVRIFLRRRQIRRAKEWQAWREWWVDARKDPALADAFAEHDRREAGHPKEREVTLAQHVRRLRAAGFRTTDVVWQILENRVLLGIR